MLFTLCKRYSEIALRHFFERNGIAPIYVTDSIKEMWIRSLSSAKIVSEQHLSAKCEHGLNANKAFGISFFKIDHLFFLSIRTKIKIYLPGN